MQKKITYQQTLAVETGFRERNSWIDRMVQMARQAQTGDCLICARARPDLMLGPTAFEDRKPEGTPGEDVDCLLNLMSTENPSELCKPWEAIFPMASAETKPPVFQMNDLENLTCFRNDNTATKVHLMGYILTQGPKKPL